MFLFEEASGMTFDELVEIFDIDQDVVIDYTLDGEPISLANSHSYESSGSDMAIYFVVWQIDALVVSQLWMFQSGYKGLHPIQFME